MVGKSRRSPGCTQEKRAPVANEGNVIYKRQVRLFCEADLWVDIFRELPWCKYGFRAPNVLGQGQIDCDQ